MKTDGSRESRRPWVVTAMSYLFSGHRLPRERLAWSDGNRAVAKRESVRRSNPLEDDRPRFRSRE